MYINKVISFNSSWELLHSKPNAYDDICTNISLINEDILVNPDFVKPHYEEENPTINPFSFVRAWETLSRNTGWRRYMLDSDIPDGLKFYIRNFKDGISTKFLTTDRMHSFPNWVLIESQKFAETDLCDLSVLIVPMESVKELYADPRRMGPHLFFERTLSQLKDLLPLNQHQPFLIIGISSEEEPIEVTELFSGNSETQIQRVLEFPKEHYQAGVGILSYFGEIIKQKYPDIDAKVRIEQEGNIVRMIIDAPDGTRDIVEEALDKYALVVTNKASAETLLDDKLQIHALTNKLAIAELEVKQTRDLLHISEKYSDKKINSLEDDVRFLREHVGKQIHHMNSSQEIISFQSKKEEKLLLTQLNCSERTISQLITESSNRSDLREALITLNKILENLDQNRDEIEAKEALTVIRDASPEVFDDLSVTLKNTMYGVSGNIAFHWLQQIGSLVP